MRTSEVGFRQVYGKVSFIWFENDEHLMNMVRGSGLAYDERVQGGLFYTYINREYELVCDVLTFGRWEMENGNDDIDLYEDFVRERNSIPFRDIGDHPIYVFSDEEWTLDCFDEYIRFVEVINYPHRLESVRKLDILDQFRHNEYPDDLKVFFAVDVVGIEQCWMRSQGIHQGRVYGRLLNEPYKDFGIHKNDIIETELLTDTDAVGDCLRVCLQRAEWWYHPKTSRDMVNARFLTRFLDYFHPDNHICEFRDGKYEYDEEVLEFIGEVLREEYYDRNYQKALGDMPREECYTPEAINSSDQRRLLTLLSEIVGQEIALKNGAIAHEQKLGHIYQILAMLKRWDVAM